MTNPQHRMRNIAVCVSVPSRSAAPEAPAARMPYMELSTPHGAVPGWTERMGSESVEFTEERRMHRNTESHQKCA